MAHFLFLRRAARSQAGPAATFKEMHVELETRTANELATGSPGSIDLGGKTYLVAQPSPHDMSAILLEVKRLARKRYAARQVELFREFRDLATVKQLLAAELGDPESEDPKTVAAGIMDGCGDPAACRFIALVLLRHNHPDVTPELLRSLITDDNAAIVGMELLLASGLGRVLPNSPGASGSSSPAAAPTETTTTPPAST